VRNVWLEFDLIAASCAHPRIDALERPSVFWGPNEIGRNNWEAFASLVAFVRDRFASFPESLPLASIECAVRHLPDAARVFQVGAMRSRGDVVLRMCINHLPPSDMPGWLEAQDWNGDSEALGWAVAALVPHVRVMALDVDFTSAGIGPKIGVECYLRWSHLDSERWLPLLNHVSGLGLCIDAKRQAIRRFPAKTEYSLREQWARAERGVIFPVVYRNIHHVKLSFAGHAFHEAKAYLGITRPGVRIDKPITDIPAGDPEEWLAS
jgi:hypothetical protein